MPGLVMPAFFGESFRRGESFKDEPLGVAADDEFGAPTVLHSSSSGDALAEPATPVDRISGVVMLAPQILLKRGPLSKRSKHMSKMWQLRHVEVEGAPTHGERAAPPRAFRRPERLCPCLLPPIRRSDVLLREASACGRAERACRP